MPHVVDTNVPVTANAALNPEAPVDLLPCISNCVSAIEQIVKSGRLVLDRGDEIFEEYRTNLSLKGQPGVGDRFMKWVHDNRWSFPPEDLVEVNRVGDSYTEFPNHPDLEDFDISDRKFVAVAHSHRDRPSILEATDSKWWGWKTSLAEVGITVEFLCEDWIKQKYTKKMGE